MSNKLMSIRVRQNNFGGLKKLKKYYKSMYEQINHDLRNEEIQKGYLTNPKNKNINTINSKIKNNDNVDFKLLNKNLNKMFEDVKKDYKSNNNNKSWQKKSRPFLTGLISFSSEFMPNIEDSQKLHNELDNFIQSRFGEIITTSTHRDEKSLHYHFNIFNYDKKSGKSIGRSLDTFKLQDELFEWLNSKGLTFEHKRGIPKKETKAKHLEVMEAKRIENEKLTKENEELKKENQELTELFLEFDEVIKIIKGLGELDKAESFEDRLKELVEKGQTNNIRKLIKRAERTTSAILKKQYKEKGKGKVSNTPKKSL